VNDVVEMQKLQTDEYTSNEEFGLHFFKSTSRTHMVSEITTDQ